MTIFDIDNRIRECEAKLADAFDEKTGEITDEDAAKAIMAELNYLDIAHDKKIEGACLLRREVLRERDALDAEIKRLVEMKKARERRAERLKKYIELALGGAKFKSDLVSVYYRKNDSVKIMNDEDIPDRYWKITREPRKSEIMTDLRLGKKVPGAELEESINTIIR